MSMTKAEGLKGRPYVSPGWSQAQRGATPGLLRTELSQPCKGGPNPRPVIDLASAGRSGLNNRGGPTTQGGIGPGFQP
jgi:hypothetical protein